MSRTQGGYASNEALLSFPVVKIMDVFVGRALLELATDCRPVYPVYAIHCLGFGGIAQPAALMLLPILFCSV